MPYLSIITSHRSGLRVSEMSAPVLRGVHHELRAQADGPDLALLARPFKDRVVPLDPVFVPFVRQTVEHVDFDMVGPQGTAGCLRSLL